MRSTAVAEQYFLKLKTEFVNNVFKGASLRARGLSSNVNIYQEFHIFQQTLNNNELYGDLTDLDRDRILDFLIEMTIS